MAEVNHRPAKTDAEIESLARTAANHAEAIDTLARTVWGESRSEGREGMEAVANVVMNRVAKGGWWGRTVVTVCMKPWQFSCHNQNDPNRGKLLSVGPSDPQFKMALEIARAAVEGNLPSRVGQCCHYKVSSLPWPKDWGDPKDPAYVIGNHSFYEGIK